MNTFAIVKNVLLNLFHSTLRSTGRTNSLIDNASDGSVIVVLESSEIRYITTRTKELGKSVVVISDNSGDLYSVAERLRGNKYTNIYFDHRFIEKFIFTRMANAEQSINHFISEFKERK